MDNFCRGCEKYKHCTKICEPLEDHLQNDIEVKRREVLASDLNILLEETIIDTIITIDPLETKDWVVLMKTVSLTIKQKRYLFLKFWKNKTYEEIGNKYNTSKHNIHGIVGRAKAEIRNQMNLLQI